jgi:hypothetical protein
MRPSTRTAILAASLGLAALLTLETPRDTGGPTDQDRAIAMGLLLHTPAKPEVLDEGLRVAERLRRRYGIDSGNVHADRIEAALRARDEVLARLDVSPEELRESAEALGFSLDPARCRTTCDNVARLARLELEKRALQRFAFGDSQSSGG